MPITLTARATDELEEDALRGKIADALLQDLPTGDGGYEVICADDTTADFWVGRMTDWGAEVERTGEVDGEHFGTLSGAPATEATA